MNATYTSPFGGHELTTHAARDGSVGVQLAARMLPSVTLVASWNNGVAGLEQALGTALGQYLPQRTGQTVTLNDGMVVRSGPTEFLIFKQQVQDLVTPLRQAITADIGSVTDLSHARCAIRISGSKTLTVLGKLFALDLRESAFPLGECRLTGTHHVPCMLHRLGSAEFDMIVFSTYAHDQLGTVVDAALEHGVTLASVG